MLRGKIRYYRFYLILRWYIFPGRKEHSLVQLSVFREIHIHGHDAREVENVDIILDRDLEIIQWLHALHGARGGQYNARFYTRTGTQRSRHLQRSRRRQSETVLVQLYRESSHGLHRLIRERHVHADLPVPVTIISRRYNYPQLKNMRDIGGSI